MAKIQDTILTIGELAVHLKLSKSTLYHFVRDGKVPGQKVGWHWWFHKEAIDAWIAYIVYTDAIRQLWINIMQPPFEFEGR